MCGDPYPVELILGPLLHHQNCWRSSTRPDTIILETYLGFDKRRVQITLTSYHSKSELSREKVNACKQLPCTIVHKHRLGKFGVIRGQHFYNRFDYTIPSPGDILYCSLK